ncbi:NUDIX domain-containing protein [Salinimicrobium oceani]|uniref:NUDIX hydrolase n=1 Tax=Salinimicrobium oceani TaxID=2722702 RepID=A0ABX1CY50_9FLAO|nr:NUDIX hydrolase [Salinimicrobium oceani]NJW53196.1 NUDIX hydrolase [Salinimicrobium oceani]
MKQQISVTTDCVVFYQNSEAIKVLLVKRKKDPYKGQWAIPGGFLEEKETLEEGAKRELKEETGLSVDRLWQLKAFGTPGRDPRGRTVSIPFYGVVTSEEKVQGSDDAEDAQWFQLDQLPDLAFDHSEILEEAKKSYFSEIKNQ